MQIRDKAAFGDAKPMHATMLLKRDASEFSSIRKLGSSRTL